MILDTKRNTSPALARARAGVLIGAAALLGATALLLAPRLAMADNNSTTLKHTNNSGTAALHSSDGMVLFAQDSEPKEKDPSPEAERPAPPAVHVPPIEPPPPPPAPSFHLQTHSVLKSKGDQSIEERLDRLEKMVETLLGSEKGKVKDMAFAFKPNVGVDTARIQKQVEQAVQQAMSHVQLKLKDTDQIIANAMEKIPKLEGIQQSHSADKLPRDLEVNHALKQKLEVNRAAIEKQMQALEKQMKALERQLNWIEREQETQEKESQEITRRQSQPGASKTSPDKKESNKDGDSTR